MLVPVKTAAAEIIIKGSRFLGETFINEENSQVKTIIKQQKQKYADATHVCHAFILGKNAEIMGMSDDGEPGGTAGRPMLDVLKGRNVTNVLVTVTRWFGGTLLGTGGLVHAYGDSAKAVLDVTDFEELVEKKSFSILADYQMYQVVKKIMEGFTFYGTSEEFGEGIRIWSQIAVTDGEKFASEVFDRTNGKVSVLYN
mgnify:CR=1 FL=1